jgi:thiamine-phosphate pyrophosphorylase
MVTDRQRLAAAGPAEVVLPRCVAAAAEAGVHLIQVRERDLDAGPLTRLVSACVAAVAGSRARVIVNDRLDVALAAGAHGVHLPGHGVPAARVRAAVPPGFLVGRSVHHASEAARVAAEGGLDYLVFGTVFATRSKAGVRAAGVEALAAAVAAAPLPVLAIGGITAERAPLIASTGAAGIAAIGMFADPCSRGLEPKSAVAQLIGGWWARG